MRRLTALMVVWCVAIGAPEPAAGQAGYPRVMTQDSTADNLATPEGFPTAPLGSLGRTARRGDGPGTMVLIPGFGFGGEVFDSLTDAWKDDYTMWVVTLPGFGGTAPPPTPPPGTSFGAQTWTNGALDGLAELIRREDLRDVVVVGHWVGGTQLAVRLAARYPDRVRAVVLLAGSARWSAPAGRPNPSAEQRVTYIDQVMAPRWFKTVARETWDDNNFLPHDYAVHPVMGLRLWRQAAAPSLHVWVRYLCEFYAQDTTTELAGVRAPVLLVHPDLDRWPAWAGLSYMPWFTTDSWGDLAGTGVRQVTVPGTRVVLWADAREAVASVVADFLEGLPAR